MKTDREFDEFYLAELLPGLKKLEASRENVLVVAYLSAIPVIAFILAYLSGNPWWMLAAFAASASAYFRYRSMRGSYAKDYKARIVRKIVRFADERLEYRPGRGVSESQFIASGLVETDLSRFESEDLVSGRLGETEIAFSEVRTWARGGKDSSRRSFNGLFFSADFNKRFKGRTLVLPDRAERFLGEAGKFAQTVIPRDEKLVKLENPEFERLFAVYGSDPIEARYILSPSLMERLVRLRSRIKHRALVSFSDNRVILTVEYDGDAFEPNVLIPVASLETTTLYFHLVQFMAGIVDDLRLNTRVWGKE
jgi:hypothetical protein